jgi:hypothetical protein
VSVYDQDEASRQLRAISITLRVYPEAARVARGDLAPITLRSHRQMLNHAWRPKLGPVPFLGVKHSMLIKVADSHHWNKKTHNNSIRVLRRAFAFGYLDYPGSHKPGAYLQGATRPAPAADAPRARTLESPGIHGAKKAKQTRGKARTDDSFGTEFRHSRSDPAS